MQGLEEGYARMVRLADATTGGRIIDLAGGGYNPTSLGRIWALQLTALMGVVIGDDLPDDQREAERVIQHLSLIGMDRIAIVQVDDSFGADAVQGALKGLKAAPGMKLQINLVGASAGSPVANDVQLPES